MGLNLAAAIAAMNRAARTLALPPWMKLFPRHCPDWRVKGQRPANAAILARQGPKLGELRNEGARGGWANAGNGGEKLFVRLPQRGSPDGRIDTGLCS